MENEDIFFGEREEKEETDFGTSPGAWKNVPYSHDLELLKTTKKKSL